ncbi:hypothetical protein HDU81_001411 [Chytriomyces hyalinus]|nr:hypothetical protein HDU81_001411 [Chytriomyces hyalinus]
MPAPVENIAYMDAIEHKPTTQQLKAAAAATTKETSSVESNKKTQKPHVLVAETQAGYFANKVGLIPTNRVIKTGNCLSSRHIKSYQAKHSFASMPAPVENIAYMDAVELSPTTQQLKAAAAATMKETSSVESNKKTQKPHVLVAETQAGYFANKFI